MADADYGGFDAWRAAQAAEAGQGGYQAVSRGQKIVNIAGAAGSVALVVSLGWWGWELAVRDVRGVPVVRAMEGPMRIAPENPGGAVVDHQGLAVNDVAARDGAAPSDRVVLAPAPVELTLEDVPGLSTDLPPVAGDAAAGPAALALPEPAPAAPVSQEDAVALALAEALGEVAEQQDLPPGAMAKSPRPKPRPGAVPSNITATGAAAPAPAAEIDPATLTPGTRLVQFGAFDSGDQAKAEWARVAARLGPLMAGKAMVIQAAESGGHTFWRLRGHGFENEDDARRFCSAALAEGVNCIPVTHR